MSITYAFYNGFLNETLYIDLAKNIVSKALQALAVAHKV